MAKITEIYSKEFGYIRMGKHAILISDTEDAIVENILFVEGTNFYKEFYKVLFENTNASEWYEVHDVILVKYEKE
jgi:hypothetical protein